MSTSLAEQLKRLQRPQTSQFVDTRKKPSILFDVKEAANKDRETIYEIGLSGLRELIALNPNFQPFEATLFERSSKDLVRSIETGDVNRHLDKHIRKFLFQLSPFFMLQPAHKCLEWLIRRFNIESFNQDDFCMLILPYYGTRLFVRCVQIIELANTKWEWLDAVKKTGLPLSKQTLFNHLGCDQFLMQTITRSVIDAVKILDIRASSLQTLFGFYCTVVLGCLESLTQVTELHFLNILPGILKGLSSTVIDYTASANMILVSLLTKISIASNTLDRLVSKIVKMAHPSLHQDAVMVLTLIFQTQTHYKSLPQDSLDLLVNSKWFLNAFMELANQQMRVSQLYVPILATCLRKVQEKTDNFNVYKNFCENLLNYLILGDFDAEMVIRCALSNYVLKEKVSDNVITIDSGDESDIPLSDTNLDVSAWYSSYLKKIECQYPEIFSQTIKQIMLVRNNEISESRKSSLKAILGFLLTNSANEDGNTDLFENLFHHQSRCRIEAVKFLVKNFNELRVSSDRTQDLIQDCIKERLSDDDPKVIDEVMKFNTKIIIDQIGEEEFLTKSFNVLGKTLAKPSSSWTKVKLRTLKHLTEYQKWQTISFNEMFLEVLPCLLEKQKSDLDLANQILGSNLQKNCSFLQTCSTRLAKENPPTIQEIREVVLDAIFKGENLPNIEELVFYAEKIIPEMEQKFKQLFHCLQLISVSVSKDISVETARRILNVLKQFYLNKIMSEQHLTTLKRPIELLNRSLTNLIHETQIQMPKTVHFEKQNTIEISLLIDLLDVILKNLFQSSESYQKEIFQDILKTFVTKFFPDFPLRIEFLTNFFVAHTIEGSSIDPELQMMVICITNSILKNSSSQLELNELSFVRILIGLNSDSDLIKEQVMNTIEILSEKSSNFAKFSTHLLEHKEEILMDNEQISIALFNFASPDRKGKNLQDRKKIISSYVDMVVDEQTPAHLKSNILFLLQHINDPEMVKKLSIAVAQIMDQIEKDTKKGAVLVKDDFVILEQIIMRLNQNTMKVTASNMNVWENICMKILRNPHCILRDSEESIESPLMKLLEVFDEEMFSKIAQMYQKQFLFHVLKVATTVDSHLIVWSVSKFLKKIHLDGKIVIDILEHMCDVKANESGESDKGRKARPLASTPDVLLSEDWKIGVTLLENMQNKKDMKNLRILLPILFEILHRCTDFEEQSPVEYTKQILLSSILHCCQGSEKIAENVLKIDLIVQCIRGSNNPQTHHHALQLICHLAPLAPDLVLHNIMDIFTFMGSSVVRQDDAYSFQIIAKIIESVIPILIQQTGLEKDKLVIPVLKVFSDVILDVPEHRLLPMYTKLLNTLGVEKHLWIFLAILFSTHVMSNQPDPGEKSKTGDSREELPKRVQLAMAIANEFESTIILDSCCKLIDYVQTLPIELVSDAPKKVRANGLEETIFNVENCTNKQLRHIRYVIIQFSSTLTSSPEFVNKLSLNEDNEEVFKIMKPFYQKFIIKTLMCIANMSKMVDKCSSNIGHQKYWKVILHHCYDALDNAMVLLSNDMFVAVVEGLLQHAFITVRKKVLELLINKLQQKNEFIQACKEEKLLDLLDPLQTIILTISKDAKAESSAEPTGAGHEMLIVQQLALISVKLLSKHLAENHPDRFVDLLQTQIDLLKQRKEIPVVVVASIVLCIAELCANLGPVAIGQLPNYMPIFLEILKNQTVNTTIDTILVSTITAIQKLVETFPLFLSAYLVKLLIYLAVLHIKLRKLQQRDPKLDAILAKIDLIEERIGKLFPLRLLVPAVENAYSKLMVSREKIDAIAPLMSILSKSFAEANSSEIQNIQGELSNFFLNCMEFRATFSDEELSDDVQEVNLIEEKIITALVSLIMKLSESSFRPLYYKIYDWAIREADNKDRVITFYRLSSKIAEALKSLFVLFAIDFVQNSAALLNACHINKLNDDPSELYFPNSKKRCAVLVDGVVRTYLNIFTYDCKQFMNSSRFDALLKPLVDQLENDLVVKDEILTSLVSKTIAQMGMAVDDSLWRQLNYEILLKTRSNNPKVRLLGMKTCVDFARLVGEEYQALLPETIPFISELMEDEVPEVEKGCQQCIRDLESILNDTLQKYF